MSRGLPKIQLRFWMKKQVDLFCASKFEVGQGHLRPRLNFLDLCGSSAPHPIRGVLGGTTTHKAVSPLTQRCRPTPADKRTSRPRDADRCRETLNPPAAIMSTAASHAPTTDLGVKPQSSSYGFNSLVWESSKQGLSGSPKGPSI